MNSKNENLLLDFLYQKERYTSGTILANKLNVSTRTIRNYIKKINKNHPNLVLKSSKGYMINKKEYYSHSSNQIASYENTSRKLMILKKMLIDNTIDIFDFSIQMHVSIPTIEKDIYKIKQEIEQYGIQLIRENYQIQLIGSERSKRKLISKLLQVENETNFILQNNMVITDLEYNFKNIKNKINTIFYSNRLFINDYSLNSITIHIIIIIDRIRQHYDVNISSDLSSFSNQNALNVSHEIATYISSIYNVRINDNELYEIALLVLSKSTDVDHEITINELSSVVDPQIINLTKDICECVKRRFGIEFRDDSFVIKFAIHIMNLSTRSRLGYPAKNPIKDKIKATHPLMYEIAVYISSILKEELDLTLNDDEIGFIVFHLGAQIENNFFALQPINTIIICPKYYNMQYSIESQIKSYFDDNIVINAIYVNDSFKVEESIDLIITILDDKKLHRKYNNIAIVSISPFFTQVDKNIIHEKLIDLAYSKKTHLLRNSLKTFYKHQLFYKNVYFNNEFEAIDFLTDNMINMNYVKPIFKEEVLQREKMSSTAFTNNIAIPHSFNTDALNTAISIIINDQPIRWGKFDVYVIVLFAVKEEDRHLFRDMLDSLIDILSNIENFKSLLNIKSYDDFINYLANVSLIK